MGRGNDLRVLLLGLTSLLVTASVVLVPTVAASSAGPATTVIGCSARLTRPRPASPFTPTNASSIAVMLKLTTRRSGCRSCAGGDGEEGSPAHVVAGTTAGWAAVPPGRSRRRSTDWSLPAVVTPTPGCASTSSCAISTTRPTCCICSRADSPTYTALASARSSWKRLLAALGRLCLDFWRHRSHRRAELQGAGICDRRPRVGRNPES